METLAWIALGLALLPLLLGLWNLALYRRAPRRAPPGGTAVSVLIPARNEEANIGDAVRAVLASRDVDLEVVVLDDHSTDQTAAIVREIAATDPRARLELAPPLPEGWSGKQHACWVLSQRARHDLFLYQDADVRLAPDAVARLAAFMADRPRVGLVSGFPQELTATTGERLLIPMIHVLLLGYLPMAFMRLFRAPGFGAGCGQLMMIRREAYEATGGHRAIKRSLHDGVTLPPVVRRAGWWTDLVDATDIACCRMYRGWAECWAGFSKNAGEGMAKPVALPVWTLLLAGGHLLPWALLVYALLAGDGAVLPLAAAGVGASMAYRSLLALRFRQSWQGVLLHPAGVAAMLALQWSALLNPRRPAVWRGRAYTGSP